MHSILDNLEIRYVNDAVVAGSSIDDNSTIIDMTGYESVTFMVPITDSVNTGVATLKVEQNTANSDSGMTAVSGASVSATSGANDDLNGLMLAVEVRNSGGLSRYVQAVVTSATANIAYGATTAILKPYRVPVTQGATVSASATVSV